MKKNMNKNKSKKNNRLSSKSSNGSKKISKNLSLKNLDTFGGIKARERKGPLWKFTPQDDGSFIAPNCDFITGLYFPLFNLEGMKSSITPQLKGDICLDFHKFLTIPQVTEDFHLSKASRNFWIYVKGEAPWSVTGVSSEQSAQFWKSPERARVEAGLGWFQVVRQHSKISLQATSTIFVPASDHTVEVMIVTLKNMGRKKFDLTPTSVSPIFGRGGDNLRDHRQVTSMFNEVEIINHGVSVKARIVHDEKGHRKNNTEYITLGFDEKGQKPDYIWSNEHDFIGEGGTLEAPEGIYKNNSGSPIKCQLQDGVETLAALRFKKVSLKPNEEKSYIIVRGITDRSSDITLWKNHWGNIKSALESLEITKQFWKKNSDSLYFETGNSVQDNLLRWISFQPFCRKVYGNSYLPDHDYGRGGRGWRDLWSDLAALFLVDPKGTRFEITNSLLGVRIDGTNATIIGTKPGEFVADRNNIVRTWSDHGTWPFFILKFYLDQTGDWDILWQEISYWKDSIVARGLKRDLKWNDSQGTEQRSQSGEIYKGSIFEHVLLQQLSSFYNVGEHGNLKLEGADWNDTYDMARNRGESVCFYNWIAWNLKLSAEILEQSAKMGRSQVSLLREIAILLDRLPQNRTAQQTSENTLYKPVDYHSSHEKQNRLRQFFEKIEHHVSGEKKLFSSLEVAADLRAKAESIYSHIRKQEYVHTEEGESFYNGHYDDDGVRVHGDHPNGVRIDLTSQVMAIMCGTATDGQIHQIVHSLKRYLRNPKTGGLRLISDFKELKLNFGRVTGFAYGWRENGSIWSQQNAMLIYGLYSRGFVKEAYQVFEELINLCTDSAQSRVFPNLPSCFRHDGKGMSSYLTGSATWLILAMVTQMFGVRGSYGSLVIEPRLVKKQFQHNTSIKLHCNFLDRNITVTFENPNKKDWGEYAIDRVMINGVNCSQMKSRSQNIEITKSDFLRLCSNQNTRHEIVVRLA